MSSWHKLDDLSSMAERRLLEYVVDDEELVAYREGDKVHVFRDRCSHADVPLSLGHVEAGAIVCWKHGARFDLDTGAVLSAPATAPIDRCDCKVESGVVYVDIDSL